MVKIIMHGCNGKMGQVITYHPYVGVPLKNRVVC